MFSDINLVSKENPVSASKLVTKKSPPGTFEEWLIANNVDNWPTDISDHDDIVSGAYSEVLKSCGKDEISDKLKILSASDNSLLQEISDGLAGLKSTLLKYCSFYMVDVPAEDKTDETDLIEATQDDEITSKNGKDHVMNDTSKIRSMLDFKLKSIENTVFPGYFAKELTPLPGSLEAPQLLDYVTKLQDFSILFKKLWRKYFLSEPSVAMLQDTFWWVFLKYHHENKDGRSKSLLFNRLSSSFVSLFLTLPNQWKDLFFKHFPNCLSQAVYGAFHAAFPSSIATFDHVFAEDIANLIYEWVTGSHPYINDVMMTWKFDLLEHSGGSGKQDNADDKGGKEMKLNTLFNEESLLEGAVVDQSLAHECTDNKLHKNTTNNMQVLESHPLSSSSTLDVVSFNIYGRSPLVMHYLTTKGLSLPHQSSSKIVSRTEFVQYPITDTMTTYKTYLSEHKQQSKTRKDEYISTTKDLHKKCKQIKKQWREDKVAFEKLHEELLVRQSDIKILSEKVMDSIGESNISTKNLAKSIARQPSDDE